MMQSNNIKEALRRAQRPTLPTNFTHKTMERVSHSANRSRRRMALLRTLALTLTAVLGIVGSLVYIVRVQGVELRDLVSWMGDITLVPVFSMAVTVIFLILTIDMIVRSRQQR